MAGETQGVAPAGGEVGGNGGPVVFVVATPIGNLEDLTPRARQVLASVDIIAAEDTRRTRQLLSHCGIRGKRLVSYHDHGEARRASALIAEIEAKGLSLAVVSDAGTPAVADPGYRIAAAARTAGIKVHPIPGPSALTALVSASGLPSDRLLFVGFLPERSVPLRQEIEGWATLQGLGRTSVVFFAPTRRLAAILNVVSDCHPSARVAIGRELTKLHEEVEVMAVTEALEWLRAHTTLKGEATVMVDPGEPPAAEFTDAESLRTQLLSAARRDFAGGATLKDLLIKYREHGFKRAELYDLLLAAKSARS